MAVPWKYICLYFLIRTYGPEITSEKFHHYTKLLSKEYCKDHEDKTECIVEQIKSVVLLANDTYYAFFANLTKYAEESGIKHLAGQYFDSNKEDSDLYENPDPSKEKVNVSTAISTMLDQMEQKLKETHPGDSIKEVQQRLKTIPIDYRNAMAYCTLKYDVHPADALKLINEVAQMTKMPRRLQNILESAVKVKDAGSSMIKDTAIAYKGLVHYILIAAYRNANNSLDIGLAVYHAEYKISDKGHQAEADQDILKRLIRFLKTDTSDAEVLITLAGDEDLNAYFYDQAFNTFMHGCPALLTGFKNVRDVVKSSN